jgi:hypothetical protein
MGRGRVLAPDGTVVSDTGWRLNSLADEGEIDVLSVYFMEMSNPDKYLGLLTSTPSKDDSVADLDELNSVDYIRAQILPSDWGVPQLDAGDYKTVATEKSFGPVTGSSWAIRHAFLTTDLMGTAGKFILWVPLAGSPTIVEVGHVFRYTLATKAR